MGSKRGRFHPDIVAFGCASDRGGNGPIRPFALEPRMEGSMHSGKRALLAVVTAGVLLTTVALAMLSAASNRVPGPSLAQIDTVELMVQARDLPDQTIESLF